MTDASLRKSVLVVGDDMRIFISVVRSLGRAGIDVHVFPFAATSVALASRFISQVHRAPDFEEDHNGWSRALVALLIERTFDLVIPCADAAIMVLHGNLALFPHQRLAIPGNDAIEKLFDKERTHELCNKLGIPTAPWRRLQETDTDEELIELFGFPLVVKPRRSHWVDSGRSREKVHIIEGRRELLQCLSAISDKSSFLVEGFFEGSGTGLSVLCNGGAVLQAFQHRRLREGRGGCSSYRISETINMELRRAAELICLNMGHSGVCMFEFRINPHSGKWILLEVNARFWGSMPLPLSLGIDYPKLLFDLLVEGKQSDQKAYAVGVRSRNILLDANNLLKLLRQGGSGGFYGWFREAADFAVQPLRWIAGRETADSFSMTDMKPALRELLHAVKVLTRPISRKIETSSLVSLAKRCLEKATSGAERRV